MHGRGRVVQAGTAAPQRKSDPGLTGSEIYLLSGQSGTRGALGGGVSSAEKGGQGGQGGSSDAPTDILTRGTASRDSLMGGKLQNLTRCAEERGPLPSSCTPTPPPKCGLTGLVPGGPPPGGTEWPAHSREQGHALAQGTPCPEREHSVCSWGLGRGGDSAAAVPPSPGRASFSRIFEEEAVGSWSLVRGHVLALGVCRPGADRSPRRSPKSN